MGECEDTMQEVREIFQEMKMRYSTEIANIKNKYGEDGIGRFVDLLIKNANDDDGKLNDDTLFKQTLNEFNA